jgi:hypothetical protein
MRTSALVSTLAPFVNRQNAGSYARLPSEGRAALVEHLLDEAGVSRAERRYLANSLRELGV